MGTYIRPTQRCHFEWPWGEPTKTAHRQNGPNEGRKRPTQTKTAPTKTAPIEEKTRPKRPQLTSKTAHYVTLYKYRINDIIKCTWGILYKRVDAAAVVAAHLNVRRAWETYSAIRYSLLRRCVQDMKGRRPCSCNLSAGVFESIRWSTHIRMRLVCCSRSASFSCCKLMLTAVQSDVTHSASAPTLERQSPLERERLLKSHAFNTER